MALCALWGVCALAQGARLELREAALVQGNAVVLADVAAIEGADVRQRQLLAAVRIGAAPLAGYAEAFSRAAIEAALRSQPGLVGMQLDWRGADQVVVRRASRLVNGAELGAAARQRIEALHGPQYEQLELTQLAGVTDVQVPEGTVVLRPREAAGALRQRTAVWIDVLVDGAVYRSVAVPFQVRAWRAVPVALRALAADSVANARDFRLARQDVLALAGVPATVPGQHEQLRLRAAVAEGAVLLREQVVPAGAVRRGDRVTLVVTGGAIRIESVAVAQEDGSAGALLRVVPAGGGEAVKARVLGPGLVAIDGI